MNMSDKVNPITTGSIEEVSQFSVFLQLLGFIIYSSVLVVSLLYDELNTGATSVSVV